MTAAPLRVGIAGYGVVGTRRRRYIDENPYFLTVAVSDVKFPCVSMTPFGCPVVPEV
jgi:hypothetical protein